ncbi:copper chaperone CopZ [Cellulophaga sp. RHA19]|uniref:heavy-metal-associated domain-containing protein n=1 Tax=Cellulophaga sp. RHA19 TaxID=1798237 RepID=UPI000C2C225C|nr:heavy-metal-associated domain-containing protein [Cellulophaga sp. RHA19]PKB41884.1 copper chaperone CopZ [Cellulophaga sp. RHA19]
MKKMILTATVFGLLAFTSCKNEEKQTTELAKEISTVNDEVATAKTTFGVRGNCGMCKSTIEKAAKSVEGVASANWDVKKKQITIAFNGDKTNEEAFHKAIAESGYDTEKSTGSEDAYKELPACCKYDHEMAMSVEE